MYFQKEIKLPRFERGFHIITEPILKSIPEIVNFNIGFFQVFIKHTSASLTINENADPSVRVDFERHLNKLFPENAYHYTHTLEGSDDMPSHLKAATLGFHVMIPITKGKLNLGIWQGIYLCEHIDYASGRELVLTAFGE